MGDGRAPNKTTENDGDVEAFLASVPREDRRADARTMLELLGRVTGRPPRMWGPSIVGFGSYHYRYASGREGDAAAAGFSPRSASTTVYVMDGFDDYQELLGRLGPHSTGKSCLYLKSLGAVDLDVLEEILDASYRKVSSGGWPPS